MVGTVLVRGAEGERCRMSSRGWATDRSGRRPDMLVAISPLGDVHISPALGSSRTVGCHVKRRACNAGGYARIGILWRSGRDRA